MAGLPSHPAHTSVSAATSPESRGARISGTDTAYLAGAKWDLFIKGFNKISLLALFLFSLSFLPRPLASALVPSPPPPPNHTPTQIIALVVSACVCQQWTFFAPRRTCLSGVQCGLQGDLCRKGSSLGPSGLLVCLPGGGGVQSLRRGGCVHIVQRHLLFAVTCQPGGAVGWLALQCSL